MQSSATGAIVTITDQGYFIAVYLLIASLRYHRVTAPIYVLSVGVQERDKSLLRQFADVTVVEGDPTNRRSPCTRKGEAILAAAHSGADYIALLDGDCLATGDITPYLTPSGTGIFVRDRNDAEDAEQFKGRYSIAERAGVIPIAVLHTWQEDVDNALPESSISHTVLSGNLVIHRDYINFARIWQRQIEKVLPDSTLQVHNNRSLAYSQTDESVLNSLLAFSPIAPPVQRMLFDHDPKAYLAHLGPGDPKPWVLWRKEKLNHFDHIATLLDWVMSEGYAVPHIPWTFKRRNKPIVLVAAELYEWYRLMRGVARGAALRLRKMIHPATGTNG